MVVVGLAGLMTTLDNSIVNIALPFSDRQRNAAFLAAFTAVLGLFGVMLFMTYVMQENLGFGPLRTGLGFLPMTVGPMVSATLTPALLLPRPGARLILPGGLFVAAVALVLFSRIGPGIDYGTDLIAPFVLLGLSLGAAFLAGIAGRRTSALEDLGAQAPVLGGFATAMGFAAGLLLLSGAGASMLVPGRGRWSSDGAR